MQHYLGILIFIQQQGYLTDSNNMQQEENILALFHMQGDQNWPPLSWNWLASGAINSRLLDTSASLVLY